jgi:hypothetical protein
MRRRECRIFVVLAMAFSLVFAGCKKEADRVVSRPLNEVQGSVVATPTPTPSPSPSVRATVSPTPKGADDISFGWVFVVIAGGLIGMFIWDWRHIRQQRMARAQLADLAARVVLDEGAADAPEWVRDELAKIPLLD